MEQEEKPDDGWYWPLVALGVAFAAAGYFLGIGPLAGLEPEPPARPTPVNYPWRTSTSLTPQDLDRLLGTVPPYDQPEEPVCYRDSIAGYTCE